MQIRLHTLKEMLGHIFPNVAYTKMHHVEHADLPSQKGGWGGWGS
jgi:hypothetical protein